MTELYTRHVDLYDLAFAWDITGESWEIRKAGTRLRITWATEDVDFAAGLERQRSRIEIVKGDRAGEIIEEVHVVTLWTRERWLAAVAASPFELTATYDGEEPGRPQVAQDRIGRPLWHQLARKHQR